MRLIKLLTARNSEAPRPQGEASRKGNFVHIVPLDPAYKAGLAGHVPVTLWNSPEYLKAKRGKRIKPSCLQFKPKGETGLLYDLFLDKPPYH
jgi:hypothetical protein